MNTTTNIKEQPIAAKAAQGFYVNRFQVAGVIETPPSVPGRTRHCRIVLECDGRIYGQPQILVKLHFQGKPAVRLWKGPHTEGTALFCEGFIGRGDAFKNAGNEYIVTHFCWTPQPENDTTPAQ